MHYSIVALLVLCISSTTFAHDIGDTVVVIAERKAELKAGKDIVGTVDRGKHLRVYKVNGEWLWVKYEGKKGWIHNQDVIEKDKAIDFFTKAIRNNSKASWDFNNRGVLYSKEYKYNKSIADFSEAIRLDPKNVDAFYNRGKARFLDFDIYKAIADYSEVIRLDPTHAEAYISRAYVQREVEEFDKAIADYSKAIRLNPKNTFAYRCRGDTWDMKGDYDKAITDFTEVIRINPKYGVASAYNRRGEVRERKGEYGKAIADFTEVIRLNPKYGLVESAYRRLSWIYATCPDKKIRDGKKAVENGTKACELTDWKYDKYIDTLAAAYAENGQFEEAIKWEEKAIELAYEFHKAPFRSRLELYKSGKPYRQKPKKKP